MIKIEGLTIHLGSFCLSDLSIEIEEKGFHFLLGPTGAGKTLILESMMGLHKPQKGKIWINDREVQDLPPEKREISYVPQDLALFPHLKVKENILYGIRAKKLNPHTFEEYIQALVRVMKIEPLLERYPAHLSGGEKKRVALLRGLAPKPKLLLLDEPLTGLDPSIKSEIQQLLKTLHTSFHPTILCVTHDFEDAYLLGDKITVFINGKIEQSGTKDDIFLRPGSRRVAEFLGLKNLYRVRVLRPEDSHQRWILGLNGFQFSAPVRGHLSQSEIGEEADLYVRPEEVMILREGKPVKDSLRRNIFEGEIIDITDRGKYHLIHVQATEGNVLFEISIPNYAFRNLGLWVGKTVRIALRDESLWVMK